MTLAAAGGVLFLLSASLNHVEYCSDYRVEFVDFVRTVNPTPQAPVREECYVRRD
jgi:hypothetical protein